MNETGGKGDFHAFWYSHYALIIPMTIISILLFAEVKQKIQILQICKNSLFSDMLTALITCMSIIISIFGFLITSLISAKNDTMVKYFIENANMDVFVGKIKSVVLSGLSGILLSVLLYLSEDFGQEVLKIVIFLWIGIIFNFACNSYRFISIIISLLLSEKKKVNEKVCANEISEESVKEINENLPRF